MSESPTKVIQLTVNGRSERHTVTPRQHLADFLRENLGLKGTHLGCEHGVCGACTVRLDGQIVRGCLVLAVQANHKTVETIEGLTAARSIVELQEAFLAHNAMQCGFCSSGMLLTAAELIEKHPMASREDVRLWISGNYCRCTGYHAIVDAICAVIQARQKATLESTE